MPTASYSGRVSIGLLFYFRIRFSLLNPPIPCWIGQCWSRTEPFTSGNFGLGRIRKTAPVQVLTSVDAQSSVIFTRVLLPTKLDVDAAEDGKDINKQERQEVANVMMALPYP